MRKSTTILATYQDEIYLTPELTRNENGYLIGRGYKGVLRERFNGVKLVEGVDIPEESVFYIMECFDPLVIPNRNTPGNTGVQPGNPTLKRMINHSKKLSAGYLMSLALDGITKPLFFKQLLRRNKFLNILHHVTYTQAADELGFLFGIDVERKAYAKRYVKVDI